jgi:hypothetical protein
MKRLVAMVIGGLVTSASMLPDLFDRLKWLFEGGSGERADWGEAAFYVVVSGFPGALAGAALVSASDWWRRRSSRS